MFGVHPLKRSRYTEDQCTAELAEILETSPRVARLLQAIFALNKGALKRGITCRSCFGTVQEGRAGYYDGGHKRIVVCSDKVRSKEHLEETVVHELVHALDFTRSGQFQSFCHMIACAEVRASALGQCYNIKSPSLRNECIWRDAVNSTAKDCGGLDLARLYVQQVFDTCVKDTAPFEPNVKNHQTA